MVKKQCAVVIPIYKDAMVDYERASYIQCLKTLKFYDIIIVTNRSVNIDSYKSLAHSYKKDLSFIFFEEKYFNGINGYNILMKSYAFYKKFDSYEYILIYQLDAYVFKDMLAYWCNQGYDYIGAPWFSGFKTHEEGCDLWAVGNGGLSLRRIEYFLKVLSWKLPVKLMSFKDIFHDFRIGKLLYNLGWKNNIPYYILHNVMYEDVFYCVFLENSLIPPRKPSIEEALTFSIEKSPAYLFSLNKNELPFGCHGFQKYDYDSFWKKYIKIDIIS